jgi:hypothetical protein
MADYERTVLQRVGSEAEASGIRFAVEDTAIDGQDLFIVGIAVGVVFGARVDVIRHRLERGLGAAVLAEIGHVVAPAGDIRCTTKYFGGHLGNELAGVGASRADACRRE